MTFQYAMLHVISQQPENCENRNDPDLVQTFLKKLDLKQHVLTTFTIREFDYHPMAHRVFNTSLCDNGQSRETGSKTKKIKTQHNTTQHNII
jgi:hypothetical protein